jgi:hypothetical protein
VIFANTADFSIHSTLQFSVPQVTNPHVPQPSISNMTASVLDSNNLVLGVSFEGVFPAIINPFGSSHPTISLSNLAIAATHVSMSITFSPTIATPSLGMLMISISGSAGFSCAASSALTFSSPSSGAAGQVNSCSVVTVSSSQFQVIQITYNLGTSSPANVSFSFSSVVNPNDAQPGLRSVLAAILNHDGTTILGKSVEGSYPEILRTFGRSKPSIKLSDIAQGTSSVLMTVTLTPATRIELGSKLVFTVAGSGFSCGSGPVSVHFNAPTSGSPSAVTFCNNFEITARFDSGVFPIHKSITFVIPGVTNPSSAQNALSNIQAALMTSENLIIGRDFVGTFPAIEEGSLGPDFLTASLSSIIANASHVSMFITMKPAVFVPAGSYVTITLTGSTPQHLSEDKVIVLSPSEATDPTLSPSASVSLISNVVIFHLKSGVFLGGNYINVSLPSTVQNPAAPQNALTSIPAALISSDGVILAKSSSGTMVAIVSGSLGSNAPAITLSNLAKNSGSVTMTIALTPAETIPTGSTILITLGGSAPQSLSASTVAFTSAGTGSPTAAAGVTGGVLSVTITGGSLSGGSAIALTLPGTVTNANVICPALENVAVGVIDSQAVEIAASSIATHPAVLILFCAFNPFY